MTHSHGSAQTMLCWRCCRCFECVIQAKKPENRPTPQRLRRRRRFSSVEGLLQHTKQTKTTIVLPCCCRLCCARARLIIKSGLMQIKNAFMPFSDAPNLVCKIVYDVYLEWLYLCTYIYTRYNVVCKKIARYYNGCTLFCACARRWQ